VINLLTAILVADVLRELVVAAMASRLAFRSSWASTYDVVAFGVCRLSVSLCVYMLVAVRAPTTVAVVDVKNSVAIAEALAQTQIEFAVLSYRPLPL
jgi:phage-related holin